MATTKAGLEIELRAALTRVVNATMEALDNGAELPSGTLVGPLVVDELRQLIREAQVAEERYTNWLHD